jgi:hypothetical protein
MVVSQRLHVFQLLQPLLLLNIAGTGVLVGYSLRESFLDREICSGMFNSARTPCVIEVWPEEAEGCSTHGDFIVVSFRWYGESRMKRHDRDIRYVQEL